LFIFKDGDGNWQSRVTLRSPSGILLLNDAEAGDVNKKPNVTHTSVVGFAPFRTTEFGQFTISLRLGNAGYERTFSVNRGLPPAAA
jgi:hypothetical protein